MRFRAICSLATVIVACSTWDAALAAQRYVTRDGVDSATCGLDATPCKTLAAAVTAASAGDRIICRDPGGSESFLILRGLEIECSSARQQVGGNVSLGGSAASAIVIDTSSSSDKTVRIRGLNVGGATSLGANAAVGIYIKSGTDVVHLEDVVVNGVTQIGIQDARIGNPTKLFIKDSIIRNNGGPGIVVASPALSITVLDNVTSENNTYGIAVANGNSVAITRSVFSGNSVAGVEGDNGAKIILDNNTVTHNGQGIQSNSSVRLSNNNIAFNNTAISGFSGTFGNNRFSANVSFGTAPTALGGATSDLGQQ